MSVTAKQDVSFVVTCKRKGDLDLYVLKDNILKGLVEPSKDLSRAKKFNDYDDAVTAMQWYINSPLVKQESDKFLDYKISKYVRTDTIEDDD